MSGEFLKNINYLEGLYVYGSGEMDQLKPLNENVEEKKHIFESSIPRKISLHFMSNNETIKSIKCGQFSTIILSTEGNVYSFGCSDNGGIGHEDSFSVKRVPIKFPAIGISGGDAHGIAYDRNNLAFWGQFRSSKKWIDKPCFEPTYFNNSHINGEFFKKAISGINHVIILSEKKNVYAFGCNEFGQIGVNPMRVFHHFQINKLYEKNVEDIFTGDEHSFLTKIEGEVKILKAWGSNGNGQLGIGSYATKVNENFSIYVPTKVIFPGISKISVKKVEGGNSTSICITEDNRVFVWGLNDFSQLGLKNKEKIIPRPREIMFFNPNENPNNSINEIYANNQYFYAKNDTTNKVYSWGIGDNYVLGNRKEKAENSPYLVNHLFFKNLYVSDISLGSAHVAALLIEKKDIKSNMSQQKSKETKEINNKKILEKGIKSKSNKRKNDELPSEKKEKEKDKNIEALIKIKEEYITLNGSDKPKSSAKKLVAEKIFIENCNINKITEEEKEKAEKIENMNSNGKKYQINLENNSSKKSKKSKEKNKSNYSKKKENQKKEEKNSSKKKNQNNHSSEKIDIEKNEDEEKKDEKNEKSLSKSNRKKSQSKKEKNEKSVNEEEETIYPKKISQSKSKKEETNQKYEKIDIEKNEAEEKEEKRKEKASSKNKNKKISLKPEKETKEESENENIEKEKSKIKKKISLSKEKEKDRDNEKQVYKEEDKKEKSVRKSSRNKINKNGKYEEKNEDHLFGEKESKSNEKLKEEKKSQKNSKKSKNSKKDIEEQEKNEDNDENSENNDSERKYNYPKKEKTRKKSISKKGNSREKSQRTNKSKSKEKYPKKK